MGYDQPCISFVHGYVLFLVVFLVLYIFVVGGVTYVYMCGFLVDRVRLSFGIYVLVHPYLCLVSFSLFYIFVLSCGSSAPNEDIVRFRCGGSYALFEPIFVKIFNFCYTFSWFWGCLCLFYWFFISIGLVASCI